MSIKTQEIPVGVVGLGLMGCSITTCLLIAGHPVIAVAPIPLDLDTAWPKARQHLVKSLEEGLTETDPDLYLKQLVITQDFDQLRECRLVIECTIENLDIKRSVYAKIEGVVAESTVITSNTSAIPITL